jgi:exocyst complex component 2
MALELFAWLWKVLNRGKKERDYGLTDVWLDASIRADQIYGPVVERRQRVEKVRSTLSVLQQYKFFFNLPSSLLESIKQVNEKDGCLQEANSSHSFDP